MSKWFEVRAEILQVYLVEVNDNEDIEEAEEIVANEICGEFDNLLSEEIENEHVAAMKIGMDHDKILKL